ncbi:hypothetical protein [Stieleria neptunia]|uniref:hypothetical protein n=1 Tax=Stieleria neptunia TaxID=2527979 RepID=UPI0018D254AE|nr:hypothetical protein [Stieleria neptunia]
MVRPLFGVALIRVKQIGIASPTVEFNEYGWVKSYSYTRFKQIHIRIRPKAESRIG